MKGGKEAIIITEIPFMVNKARMLERIAELVKEKKLEGISEIRDESDKDGMRVVVEIKKGEVPEVILNNLIKNSQLEQVFGINNVVLVDSAIKKSELGLNPQIDGQLIRLPIPELNEERRKDLKKMIKSMGEKCKISIRNIRRDANEELKKL